MRFRLLAFGLIAGLLAACTSSKADPKPTPSPTSPVATTSSAAPPSSPSRTGPLTTGPNVRPGEKPPVLPSEGAKHTQFGATVFGAYYFRALDWSIATNDATAVKEISAGSCKACQRVSAAIKTLHDDGETETGGRITLRSFEVVAKHFSTKSDVVVKVVYDEAAVRLSKVGARPRTTVSAVKNAASYVFLDWVDRGWRVVEVTQA